MLASRVQLAVAGAYANGQTGGSPEVAERFERLSITNQLRLLITEEWSVVVSYSHYRHTLNEAAQEALGVLPGLNRNSAYVGISLRVPLVGTLRNGRRPERGN